MGEITETVANSYGSSEVFEIHGPPGTVTGQLEGGRAQSLRQLRQLGKWPAPAAQLDFAPAALVQIFLKRR